MRRNNHPVAELELMAYLDGALPRERAAAAAAHLEQCSDCQKLAGDLREISEELAGWEVEPFDVEITPSLSVAFEEHRRLQEQKARRNWSWRDILNMRVGGGALAAVALLLFVISLTTTRYASTQKETILWQTDGFNGFYSPPKPSAAPTTAQRRENEKPLTRFVQQLREKADLSPGEAPMIVRTADLVLVTKELDKARAGIEEIVRRHHGYLGSLSAGAATGSARTLQATLRMPTDQLEATISELKSLGRVESESQSGDEVTQQYVDLEARLTNARHTEQRLTDLLRQRTGKLSDVLAVEQEIDRVRGEIERMDAEKKDLAKRVALATLSVRVAEEYQAQLQVVPVSTATRFRNAAVDGYESVRDSVISLALFLISWGPSVLLWAALLFFPARYLARYLWKRFRGGII